MAGATSERPWEHASDPEPGIPSMISAEERRYLYWLGSEVWSGEGHVVEMGPWLGGSTACLAAGMRASGRETQMRLHAIDNFVWRAFMAERAPLGLGDGASFRAHFEANLARFSDLVVVTEASLPDEEVPTDPLASAIRDAPPPDERLVRWSRSEPVEILFVDGAKSWTAMVHLLRELGPSLLPSRALLVCQDYKYWGAYWVPLALELLREHLELVHVLERNTVAFRVREQLPAEALERLPPFSGLEREASLAALDAASERLRERGDPLGAAIVEVAKVRLLGNLGDLDGARRAFRGAERRWPAGGRPEQLERARAWLEEASGETVAPALAFRARRRGRRALRRLRTAVAGAAAERR
jgi:hypothetical protein